MKDMTKGYPAKVILAFAVPVLLGSIFQQFYNIADSKIVSNYVGTNAFAAVGATSVISNLMIGLLNGMTQGFAIPVANSFGAKDMERLRKNVAGTVVLSMGISVILTILGLLFIRDILVLLHTPDDIIGTAAEYITVILIGVIFTTLYNMCANILRAVGDSQTPVYCLIVAVIINIGLDLLFVCYFNWGIQGAAAATVISQALSGIICGGVIIKKFKDILPDRNAWSFQSAIYSELFSTGLSMGLMSCIVNIGTVVLQGAINSLGTTYVTAHAAARKIFDVFTVTIYSVGISMTTFASQNTGAGRPDRVRQGVRHAILINCAISTVLIVLCYTLGRPVLTWITSSADTKIIDTAVQYTRISILFFYVLGALFVLRCSLQGMGRKVIPVCSSVLEMVVKVLSANLLVPVAGYMGVIFTEPISWIVMTMLLSWAYFSKKPEHYIPSVGVIKTKES